MDKKRVLGQFFTKDEVWLKPQVVDFIKTSGCSVVYDPFAGEGDLLNAVARYCGLRDAIGLDIDEKLNWRVNDSLLNIPSVANAIIVTNPPYIANYSASRKGVSDSFKKYFSLTEYNDIYMLALDRMLCAQQNVVAIVPETFINSKYRQKHLLHSITILEDSPFGDTDNPVVVACFDGMKKSLSEIGLYKNDRFVDFLGGIERLRIRPNGLLDATFNNPAGWLAVRCVDTTNPQNMIRFGRKEDIDYDWSSRIKVSSRLLTLVDLDVPEGDRSLFIDKCNKMLWSLREKTGDVILSPFKGNMKDGRRRRRLDFMTCRAIIECVYSDMYDVAVSPLKVALLSESGSIEVEGAINARQQVLF